MIVDGSFTLKVETEQDILLIAELLQRKKDKPLGKIPKGAAKEPPSVNLTKGHQLKVTESHRKMLDLIKANHPSGSFHVSDAAMLIKKQMKLGRTSAGNALKTGVKIGELRNVKHGIYTFENHQKGEPLSIHPNEDFLVDLIADRPDGLLELCRIARTLSNELVLVIENTGICCRLTDGHQQIMLDMTLEKSLFSAYHLKKPIEVKLDASTLYSRLERAAQLHLSLKQENSALLVGNYELKLNSYRDFDGKVASPAAVSTKSELLIGRQGLEQILSDNAVNCQHVDIICEKDHLTFESHSEAGDYKLAVKEGYDCLEPSRSRLNYQADLLRCLKASRCEMVKLGIGAFLQVEFLMDPAIKILLFLATKKELEAVQGVSRNAM
jgi:hypothetical protein